MSACIGDGCDHSSHNDLTFESHEYKVGFKNAIARIKKDILDTEIDDVIRDE